MLICFWSVVSGQWWGSLDWDLCGEIWFCFCCSNVRRWRRTRETCDVLTVDCNYLNDPSFSV